MDKETIVINFFGEPSTGKSTAAAYVYSQLKMAGVEAEYVSEYAKDKVWEENSEIFKPDNQAYLFGKQFYKMSICKNKVEVIVTDSPLFLNILYNKSEVLGDSFNHTVLNCFNSFDNRSYFLTRDFAYENIGRRHSEEQSQGLRNELYSLLKESKVDFEVLKTNCDNYDRIVADTIYELSQRDIKRRREAVLNQVQENNNNLDNEETYSLTTTEDITGTIGAWLDSEIDAPKEVIKSLQKTYDLAVKGISKPLEAPKKE